ncbi:hypothetical protein [Candidatus Symbiopectobacterium sp. NZEC135]|uniref:hypothetical protein n=1 Tax=Candidatus Symbiopectobacterium sp. NZEC135 TaxID=2820471 RepID=UPI0022277EC2|nr:hypothetical protein [Candidatus Symbiopectobacterium sp. NZEC135]MCW2478061.1 hypothetical protein [Candidatus Symbiopectobacterium sp. NZEC135]
MFDDYPLALEEVIDQCRTLAYAVVELDKAEARDILMFMLQERIECLQQMLQLEQEGDNAELTPHQ